MRRGRQRNDLIRIRRTAPRMWNGAHARPCEGEHPRVPRGGPRDLARVLRASVPVLRGMFEPRPEPFFWAGN